MLGLNINIRRVRIRFIVLDWVRRQAIPDPTLGVMLSSGIQSTRPTRSCPSTYGFGSNPAKYITDLDFADDIALVSNSIQNAVTMLNKIEHFAALVGLKIKRKKTEFILYGSTCSWRYSY